MDGIAKAEVDWRGRTAVHFFVVPHDIRLPPARYNFAFSVGSESTPAHMSVISLNRLQAKSWRDGQDTDPDRTAERVFKLIAKNTVKMTGYQGGELCLFTFPNNLDALDALPLSFCEPDNAALIAAGILQGE